MAQTTLWSGNNGYGYFSLSPNGDWSYTPWNLGTVAAGLGRSLVPMGQSVTDELQFTTVSGVLKRIRVGLWGVPWVAETSAAGAMAVVSGSGVSVSLGSSAQVPSGLGQGHLVSDLLSTMHVGNGAVPSGVALTGLGSGVQLWVSTNDGLTWRQWGGSDLNGMALLLANDGQTRLALLGPSGSVLPAKGLANALSYVSWDSNASANGTVVALSSPSLASSSLLSPLGKVTNTVTLFNHTSPSGTAQSLASGALSTNLLLYSQALDVATWLTSSSGTAVKPNSTTVLAPDGTATADFLTETGSGFHDIKQATTLKAAQVYTYSVYFKAGTQSYAALSLSDGASAEVGYVFDLTGTASPVKALLSGGAWSYASAQMVAQGDGWFRCSITATKTGSAVVLPKIFVTNGMTLTSYASQGKGIYAWGAQLEAGVSTPSDYIATTSQSVAASEVLNPAEMLGYACKVNVTGAAVGDCVQVLLDGLVVATSAVLTTAGDAVVSVPVASAVLVRYGSGAHTWTTRLVNAAGITGAETSTAFGITYVGSQTLNGSAASESMRGGPGADVFNLGTATVGGSDRLVYQGSGDLVGQDTVNGFTVGAVTGTVGGGEAQGDVIVLRDVFASSLVLPVDPLEQARTLVNGGWVTLLESGGNVVLAVDTDGSAGSAISRNVLTLSGKSLNGLAGVGSGATAITALAQLIANGQLVVMSNRRGSIGVAADSVVAGSIVPGSVLTATLTDPDGLDWTGVAYQWMANGMDIAGAQQRAFTVTTAQQDQQLSVRATYLDALGYSELVVSDLTEVVPWQLPIGVNDWVVLNSASAVHRLWGFEAWNGTRGDRLDVSNLLQDYVQGVSDIRQWLSLSVQGGNSVLTIDADGSGAGSSVYSIQLPGVNWSGRSVTDLVASGQLVTNTVTLGSLLAELDSRSSRALFPRTPYVLKQFSSTEPTSNDPTNANGRWFANDDFNNFIRKEGNEYVIFDDVGPGAMVRLWVTSIGLDFHNTIIRFYIDGQSTPIISGSIYDIVRDDGLVANSVLSYSAAPGNPEEQQANNLYLPIPYAKELKITVENSAIVEDGFGANGSYPSTFFYYNIDYRDYAPDVAVQSFSKDILAAQQSKIAALNTTLTTSYDASLQQTSKALHQSLVGGVDAAASVQVDGSQAISSLVLKVNAADMAQALRSTVLAIDFDGQERVWVPVGEFFGTGYALSPFKSFYTEVTAAGEMKASWYMPFQSNAKISVINYGTQAVDVDLNVGYVGNTWVDDSMYFNAKWHQYDAIASTPARDLNYITITGGRGVYVGDTLSLFNGVKSTEKTFKWWGEGDEKIYIDGELLPSTFGTGTEDYYGYSHSKGTEFYNPFTNQVFGTGAVANGPVTDSRYRLLDGLAFNNSLKFDMELWHQDNNYPGATSTLNYAPAVFYYSDGRAVDNIVHDIDSVRADPRISSGFSPDAVIGVDKNSAFEGYDILILAGQSNTYLAQNLADMTDVKNQGMYMIRTSAALSASWRSTYLDGMQDGIATEFARRYAATQLSPSRKLLIIDGGASGTGFLNQNNGTLDWDANTGAYALAVKDLTNAIMSANSKNKIIGMLWQQGENNGYPADPTYAVLNQVDYQSSWLGMIKYFETNVTGFSAATPVFNGQMVYDWMMQDTTNRKPVDDALRNLSNLRDNTFYIASDTSTGLYKINSYSPSGDLVHYGSSALDLGGRYFDAYQNYLVNQQAYAAPVRMLVGGDNVLTQSELGVTNVKVRFAAGVAGYVQLYVDGQAVGARQSIQQNQLSLTLNSSDLGADGVKHLTLQVFDSQTSGTALSGILDGAVVQLNASQVHWSSAAQALWLNPDAIMSGSSEAAINGSSVAWLPSAGAAANVALRNVVGDTVQARLYVDGVNGHNTVGITQGGLYLNASDITATLPTSNSGDALTMMVAAVSNASAQYQKSLLSFGLPSANAGVVLGASNSAAVYGAVQAQSPVLTGAAAATGNWDVLSLTAGVNGSNYVVQVGADGGAPAVTSVAASTVNFNSASNQLVIGQAVGGAAGSTAASWDGDIGDVVVSGQTLTLAQKQEIQTYLSEKYETTATMGLLVSQSADSGGKILTQTMSLTFSASSSKIIDNLYVSDADARVDVVQVAGADYVRTGAGNDVVEVMDLNFRQLDGGAGKDTLKINAAVSSVDLTQLVSNARYNTTVGVGEGGTGTGGWHKLYSFEQIDLTNSSLTSLSLKAADVLELSETKTLLIRGDKSSLADTVTLLATETWTPSAANGSSGQVVTDASGATVYAHQFTSNVGGALATLWVEDGLKLAYNGSAGAVL
jgi:VCBS repeat-containing protein